MACQIIRKLPGELKVITLDFSNFDELSEDGETVTGVNETSVEPEGLTLGAETFTASTGSVVVSGGTPGMSYRVTILVDTSEDHIIGDIITVDVI